MLVKKRSRNNKEDVTTALGLQGTMAALLLGVVVTALGTVKPASEKQAADLQVMPQASTAADAILAAIPAAMLLLNTSGAAAPSMQDLVVAASRLVMAGNLAGNPRNASSWQQWQASDPAAWGINNNNNHGPFRPGGGNASSGGGGPGSAAGGRALPDPRMPDPWNTSYVVHDKADTKMDPYDTANFILSALCTALCSIVLLVDLMIGACLTDFGVEEGSEEGKLKLEKFLDMFSGSINAGYMVLLIAFQLTTLDIGILYIQRIQHHKRYWLVMVGGVALCVLLLIVVLIMMVTSYFRLKAKFEAKYSRVAPEAASAALLTPVSS